MRVLVVGAGPVGAVAAYKLACAGIDVTILESEAECREDMRASTLHPPTLEMLSKLGVFATLDAQGLRAPVYHYRNRRTQEIIAFDLTELADVTPFPFRLQCEQFKLARLLMRLLADHPNAMVHFSRRLLTLEQDSQGVTVHAEAPVSIERFSADYVIAADGANSTIRKWLGIDFEGFTYPEKFLTLSTEWPIENLMKDLAAVNYIADPHEWCVLLRVPSCWRVLVPAGTADDRELLSDATKNAVFGRLVGDARAETLITGHRTIYRVHQRVARTYRAGRVLLAGDAAHLNNPLGGFGLNAGVHDVWNLADKLIAIKEGAADPEPLLDLYDRQRRTVMHNFVQAQTIRNKSVIEADSEAAQANHQRELQDILADDERRRAYLLAQSMILSLENAAAIH
jgi:3-(3-hydroxy-phenyl)propionate hydroxylase